MRPVARPKQGTRDVNTKQDVTVIQCSVNDRHRWHHRDVTLPLCDVRMTSSNFVIARSSGPAPYIRRPGRGTCCVCVCVCVCVCALTSARACVAYWLVFMYITSLSLSHSCAWWLAVCCCPRDRVTVSTERPSRLDKRPSSSTRVFRVLMAWWIYTLQWAYSQQLDLSTKTVHAT